MSLKIGVYPAVLAVIAGLSLLVPSPRAAQPPEPFLREPYLQLATTNSIQVAWRTIGPVAANVRFGRTISELTNRVDATDIVVRTSLGASDKVAGPRWAPLRTEANLKLPKMHSAPIGTFQYEARLSGLETATRYYYAVYDGDKRLTPPDESYSFLTPPAVGTRQPVRFWVTGDGGTGRPAQAAVHQAMIDFTKSTGKPLDFWLHVGDMAYDTGRDVEFQARFFESYAPTLRSLVCWATMGNHEGYTSKGTTGIGPYYDAYVLPKRGEAGGLASGTEAYYSFNFANIHFVCLDSHDLDRKPAGAMAKWLRADLEKANAEWIIAFWHHPPYTKGNHDSDKEKDLTELRENIMPIIESGGVDLLLTGHSHIYERTMLIDGAYATPTVAENVVLNDGDGDPNSDGAYRKSAGINAHQGLVSVVTGNAGQTLGITAHSPVMKKIALEFGSTIVDVEGDTMTARMINRNGVLRDLFSIVKRGTVNLARLPLPWQPPEFKKPDAPKGAAEPPIDFKVLIPQNAEWRYLAGEDPRGYDWTNPDFDDSGWKSGPAGFGQGDAEVKTRLPVMPGRSPKVYIRREFQVEQADRTTELGLMINFSDGYVTYINGHEVNRSGVGRSAGRNAQKVTARTERVPVYVGLKDGLKYLQDGRNVIAIEAHTAPEKADLRLDPWLLLED